MAAPQLASTGAGCVAVAGGDGILAGADGAGNEGLSVTHNA